MAKRWLLPLAAALLMLHACGGADADGVMVIVGQTDFSASVEAGSRQVFGVTAHASSGSLRRLTVTEHSSFAGSVILLDTALSGQRSYSEFVYTVPNPPSDPASLMLAFEAYNTEGDQARMDVAMTVSGAAPMEAYTGIILYSARSGRPDGLSLAAMQPLYCSTAATDSIDIYDYADTSASAIDTFAREWRSRTGLSFARFADFDFAGATVRSAQAAYTSASRYTSMPGLRAGDVVLVGRADAVVAAIQVVDIIDAPGHEDDRYVLNAKRMPSP